MDGVQDRAELVSKLEKIELRTKMLVEGLRYGRHRSLFRGQGVEFADIREYAEGDDIRSIDWKVTARLNRPYVREFCEERDQTFYFVVDISGSGTFGTVVSKHHKILEVLAALGFAALRNNDRIGLCLFSDHVETFIPAKGGRKHLFHLIDTFIYHKPESKKTDLAGALRFMFRALPRRSSVIILSDFQSPDIFPALAILRRRHEVIAIRFTDRHEQELPDLGTVVLEDTETGDQVVADTSDRGFRDRYAALVRHQEESITSGFSRSGIGHVTLSTDEGYEVPLRSFFRGMKQGRI